MWMYKVEKIFYDWYLGFKTYHGHGDGKVAAKKTE